MTHVPYPHAVLLLAYMKGNANLCRAIVRAGARLGINNNQGINIFNYQVATKQLLFRLLGRFLKNFFLQRFTTHYVICSEWVCLITIVITMLIFVPPICLDMLSKEPPWCDGSNCYECIAKFGVTTRKHHWLVPLLFILCTINNVLLTLLMCQTVWLILRLFLER